MSIAVKVLSRLIRTQRLAEGLAAMQRSAAAMKRVKALLCLSSPRPLLLALPALEGAGDGGGGGGGGMGGELWAARGRVYPNHAFRVLEVVSRCGG